MQEGPTTGDPQAVQPDDLRVDTQAEQVRAMYAATEPEPEPGRLGEGGAVTPDGPDGARPTGSGTGPGADGTSATLDGPDAPGGSIVDPAVTGQGSADAEAARALADERLVDLQRLQAEFVNYRRRVERDRSVARDTAVAGVLEALLPVLDDVHLAREHGDLGTGPFAAIAEKLEATLGRLGLERYGQPGEAFDPTVHEALVHSQVELAAGTTETTVVQVLQPGYRLTAEAGDRVLRAARVAVADPQ